MLLTRHQRALITAEKYHISAILENKLEKLREISLTPVERRILLFRIVKLDDIMQRDNKTYLPVEGF